MDFQNEYDTATTGINTIVSTQLSSALQWSNIPGGLIKSSSSAAGFVWGYNDVNQIFVCQLPCTGNWTMIDTSTWNLSSVLDITTDSTNVYVLIATTDGKTVLYMNSATNTGTWNLITIPFGATNIFSTHTYIWAQDKSNNKQRCAKPCTTGNWTAVSENKVKITSASDSSLYGVDVSGNALKSDETLQSGWSSISGLSGMKLATIVGQADKTALYGIDTSSKAYRCEGDCATNQEVAPLDTGGYAPLNMMADPAGNSIWMTGTTSGAVGNIFNRLDTADYTSIMNNVNPLDQTRDKIVGNIEDQYNQQTNLMVANKQITDVVNFFTKFFKFDKPSVDQDNANISTYRDKVIRTQAEIDKMTSLEPLLQKLIVLIIGVVILYLLGSFLGTIVHTIALIVLVAGLGYIIYSSP
jgi:hypothetical protein